MLGIESAQRQADLRWSYVIWQEGAAPFLAIERLSPGTGAEDLGQTLREVEQPPTKWPVYDSTKCCRGSPSPCTQAQRRGLLDTCLRLDFVWIERDLCVVTQRFLHCH